MILGEMTLMTSRMGTPSTKTARAKVGMLVGSAAGTRFAHEEEPGGFGLDWRYPLSLSLACLLLHTDKHSSFESLDHVLIKLLRCENSRRAMESCALHH